MAFGLITILVLAGCVSIRRVQIPMTLNDFMAEQRNRAQVLKRVNARVHIEILEPGKKISGSGVLVAFLPSTLYFSIRDILGRTQFEAFVRGSDFLALYPQEKRAMRDGRGGRAFLKRLHMDLDFEELLSLSLGLVPARWKVDEETFKWSGTGYTVSANCDGRKFDFGIDGEARMIGSLSGPFQMVFDDRSEMAGIWLFNGIEVESDDRKIVIEWERLDRSASIQFPDGLPKEYSLEFIRQ